MIRNAGGGRYVENRGVTAGMDGAKYVIKLSELLSSQHQRRVSVYIRIVINAIRRSYLMTNK